MVHKLSLIRIMVGVIIFLGISCFSIEVTAATFTGSTQITKNKKEISTSKTVINRHFKSVKKFFQKKVKQIKKGIDNLTSKYFWASVIIIFGLLVMLFGLFAIIWSFIVLSGWWIVLGVLIGLGLITVGISIFASVVFGMMIHELTGR